jgi:hypothetical protein
MYHLITLLKQIRVARPVEASREPDQIVAPGSLKPFGEHGSERDPETFPRISSIPSRLVILAGIELLLPVAGLLLGLQLWNGSLWWLLTGAGIVLSVLVGYAFRSHIQLHPLDLSR